MRPSFLAAFVGLIAGAIPGGYAVWHKPAPVVVQPQTNVVARLAPGADQPMLPRAEKRRIAATWGDLDQQEIDALSDLLKKLPKTNITIFCQNDDRCGDMQLDFVNAFNTAHWDTKEETPLVDDTVGIGTSREDLRDAITKATGGRLPVKLIQKNAPFDVLTIGKKAESR